MRRVSFHIGSQNCAEALPVCACTSRPVASGRSQVGELQGCPSPPWMSLSGVWQCCTGWHRVVGNRKRGLSVGVMCSSPVWAAVCQHWFGWGRWQWCSGLWDLQLPIPADAQLVQDAQPKAQHDAGCSVGCSCVPGSRGSPGSASVCAPFPLRQ